MAGCGTLSCRVFKGLDFKEEIYRLHVCAKWEALKLEAYTGLKDCANLIRGPRSFLDNMINARAASTDPAAAMPWSA